MAEPGWDPILDGTASPYVEMKVNILTDTDGSKTYEVKYEDGEVGLYDSWAKMGLAMSAWLEGHPGAYHG